MDVRAREAQAGHGLRGRGRLPEERNPRGIQPPSLGQLGREGSGHPEKPKLQAATSHGSPWASLSPSLPVKRGAQGTTLGKGAVPNLCAGTMSSCAAEKGPEVGSRAALGPGMWPEVWGGEG